MVRNPRQASLTRHILLRDVKLFGFMKNIFNFAMSKPTVFVHILHINLNEDVFFFIVRLTAKPRYLLFFHNGKNKSNTITALIEMHLYV